MILDLIFVKCPGLQPRHKQFKDPRIPKTFHLIAAAVPHVKITDHTDTHGTRCPYGKINTVYAVNGHRMRTHFAIYIIIDSCVKLFQFCVCKLRRECVWILQFLRCPVIVSNLQEIFAHLLPMQEHRIISGLVLQFHRIALISNLRCHSYCVRHEHLDQQSLFHLMCSQKAFRICRLGIHDFLNSSPVH